MPRNEAPYDPPVLAPGVVIEFTFTDGSDFSGLHPLDRALLGITHGDFEQTHPYDRARYSSGFRWTPFLKER